MTKRALLLALILAATGLAGAAWGRAGGGHSFSGGSHSSGSSFHSSSGSSSLHSSSGHSSSGGSADDAPVGLMFGLMVVAAVVIVVLGQRQGQAAQRRTSEAIDLQCDARRAANSQTAQQIQDGLKRLGARDPEFDAPAFLARTRHFFVELQHAWSLGRFDEVRRGMSDGVLRRFAVQVALDRFWSKRNVTADVRVRDAGLAAVESDDEFDTLHVRFAASARDCDVPADLGEAEAASRAARAESTDFVETWSFVRRLNPESKAGKLSEGKCPACGAPAPRQASVTCEYCKAILNSGTYDWVLAEITQEGEFEIQPAKAIEGFARLKGNDPAVNRQVLEDRASLVFWKWVEAQATGEPKRFARVCTAHALNELEAQKSRASESLSQAAVGGVELVLCESDADFDRATFEVRWSTTGAGTGFVRTSAMTLARKSGVKTNPKTGMSTDRCHGCAAVQAESDAANCAWCGALLSQDWAFEDLVSVDAFRARRRSSQEGEAELVSQLGAIADPWERQRALAVMVAMSRADGVVTESEQRLLRSCAKRWGIEPAKLQALLAAPAEELTALTPKSIEESRVLYRALAAAALVDGHVDAEEKRLLVAMAAHLKLAPEEAQAIVRQLMDAVEKRKAG